MRLPTLFLFAFALSLGLMIAPLQTQAENTFIVEFGTLPGHLQVPGARGIYDSFLGGWQGAESLEDLSVDGSYHFGGPGSALTIGMRNSVSPRTQVRWRLSHGQARYKLPDGVGIFIDPATISLSFLSLSGEVSYRLHDFKIAQQAAEITGSIGVISTRIDSRFRSALLDVRDRTTTIDGFLRLGAEWSLVPGPAEQRGVPVLGADIRHYEGGVTDLSIALRARF